MLPFIEDGVGLLRDIQQFYQIGEMVYVIIYFIGSLRCSSRNTDRLEDVWNNKECTLSCRKGYKRRDRI